MFYLIFSAMPPTWKLHDSRMFLWHRYPGTVLGRKLANRALIQQLGRIFPVAHRDIRHLFHTAYSACPNLLVGFGRLRSSLHTAFLPFLMLPRLNQSHCGTLPAFRHNLLLHQMPLIIRRQCLSVQLRRQLRAQQFSKRRLLKCSVHHTKLLQHESHQKQQLIQWLTHQPPPLPLSCQRLVLCALP